MQSNDLETTRLQLLERVKTSEAPSEILRAPEFKSLYSVIGTLPAEEKGPYGKAVNELKQIIEAAVDVRQDELDSRDIVALDVTAP